VRAGLYLCGDFRIVKYDGEWEVRPRGGGMNALPVASFAKQVEAYHWARQKTNEGQR
jgi:hypothetical protein